MDWQCCNAFTLENWLNIYQSTIPATELLTQTNPQKQQNSKAMAIKPIPYACDSLGQDPKAS
jgi:hypothetical protein